MMPMAFCTKDAYALFGLCMKDANGLFTTDANTNELTEWLCTKDANGLCMKGDLCMNDANGFCRKDAHTNALTERRLHGIC